MPEKLNDVKTGGSDLVFPSDASGTDFRLTEPAVYSADEVRDAIDTDDDGTPAYGRWLPVELAEGDGWLNAPGELIEELQRLGAESGEQFTVTRCEKAGRAETDPWEVNLERLSDADQERL